MWNSLQKILPSVAGKFNFQGSLEAITVCQEYRKIAARHFSDSVLLNTFPKSFQNQTLTIGVLNSIWAGQIQMKKHLILKEINEKFGSEKVVKIKIEICEKLPGENTNSDLAKLK